MLKDHYKAIDIFTHILPARFKEVVDKKLPKNAYVISNNTAPALWDMELRFRILEKYEGYAAVLTLGTPPIEDMGDPDQTPDLARLANDEMASLVQKYPERFLGAAASIPLNNIEASLREIDRAIKDLGMRGIQISSSVNGKPLDSPEFMPLWRKMTEYDLPIWIHPTRDGSVPEYPRVENESKYRLYSTFGWPFETSLAMARLVYSGVMKQFPTIKIIAHHCGGMAPYFAQRMALKQKDPVNPGPENKLGEPPIEGMRRFYTDTVIGGNIPALMCGLDFFGVDHLMFGSDYPYGGVKGELKLKDILNAVLAMPVSEGDREKILTTNAVKLLKLGN